jgi:hypothetical protein
MSRWLLAVVVFGFACAPLRAADPKPLWEVDTCADPKHRTMVVWVGFSPDGKTLVAQVEDGSLENVSNRLIVWDFATRKEKFNVGVGTSNRFHWNKRANAFTKAGTVLVAGKVPTELRLTDGVVTTKEMKEKPVAVWTNPATPEALWLLQQGPAEEFRLVLARGKMPAFEIDLKKGPPEEKWLQTPWKQDAEEPFQAFTANQDNTRLAVSKRYATHALRLYTIAVSDGLKLSEVAAVPNAHKGSINKIQFSPDSKILATGGEDSTVCLWNVEKAGKDWKPRATLSLGRGTVSWLAFSPDGRTLVAATWDKALANLFFIDPTAEKIIASYRLDGQPMSVAFSPDGKTLVTGSYTGRIQVWNAEALRNP